MSGSDVPQFGGTLGADGVHRFPVRVYYEDTDFSGAVYHAAYVKFCERGRTEFLRVAGVHHSVLAGEGIAFAVTRIEMDFKRAARIDDVLSVATSVLTVSGARLGLSQVITRDEELIAEAKVTVAAITTDGRPARLPQEVKALGAGRPRG
jgi:acyl-CoA thioester hydrolase